jgi:hypothetical protein
VDASGTFIGLEKGIGSFIAYEGILGKTFTLDSGFGLFF